jgi:hypothetical protein
MGIRTVGAWMCGWDFHNHGNIYEDLNYLVSLYPTYQQLTRVSPFPGTPLWEKLRQEGRVNEVPWEDVHFWSGAQENIALEPHETLNLTEYGYNLLYQTWGPSILRRMDVQLSGYAYCKKSSNPILRRHRAKFLRRQSAMIWSMLRGLDRHAPNGVVRRRTRKIDEKFRELIGPPTPVMRGLARAVDLLTTMYRAGEFFDPMNRNPKEEPFKKYIYDKKDTNSAIPYRTEMARPDWRTRMEMRQAELVYHALCKGLNSIRTVCLRGGDSDIDDYIIKHIDENMLGFGF